MFKYVRVPGVARNRGAAVMERPDERRDSNRQTDLPVLKFTHAAKKSVLPLYFRTTTTPIRHCRNGKGTGPSYLLQRLLARLLVVSFAAVFRLVTQERCVTNLKTAAMETRLLGTGEKMGQ